MSRHHRRLLRRLRALLAGHSGDPRPRARRTITGLWRVQWAGHVVTTRTRLGAIRHAIDLVRAGLA